jgi:hypothetical protein
MKALYYACITYVCRYFRMYECMYLGTYVLCMYERRYVLCMHVCIICMYVLMHVCICLYVYECVCVGMNIN